jgi:hypothetical protein
VITVWANKYHMNPMFVAYFDSEQEYIDAMFIQIIALNFGLWLDMEHLLFIEGR